MLFVFFFLFPQVPLCTWMKLLFSTTSECGIIKTTSMYVLLFFYTNLHYYSYKSNINRVCALIVASKSSLSSCTMRRYSNRLEDRWRERGPCPCFPEGKVPGGKEGREARKGSLSQTGKPNPDPSHSLGKWGTACGREKQDSELRCFSVGSFSPLLSHYSILYWGIYAIY